MGDKTSDVVNNICTILGGALLLYPLIDQATKTIIPEMEKLTSGKTLEELKYLPSGEEDEEEKKDKQGKKEHKPEERKSNDDEIFELKRKIAEYENKLGEHESKNDQ